MGKYHVFSERLITGPHWQNHRRGDEFNFHRMGSLVGRTLQPMLNSAAPSIADSTEVQNYLFSVEEMKLLRDSLHAWLDERLDPLEIAPANEGGAFEIRGKWFFLNLRRNRQESLIYSIQDIAFTIEACLSSEKPLYFSVEDGYSGGPYRL